MPLFHLHHSHEPSECSAAFAAWLGFESPLRRRPVATTCLTGGHSLFWRVEASDSREAREMLPAFVAARTNVVQVRNVEIP